MERFITKKELASLFSVSTRTVERWCLRGLPHLIIGENGNGRRFKSSSVEKWLEAQSKALKNNKELSNGRTEKSTPPLSPKDDVASKTESLKKIRKDKKAHNRTWRKKGGICDVV